MRERQEVFVPLVYRPGDLAEVDFFEVLVDIAGERRKAHMFLLRLMHSGRDFAWLYPRQDQTCFLDGHVRAFHHLGVVPHRLAYDNLKAAVRKILLGSERELQPRFLALAGHYLFEASFARPRTGHDKGGVEARGKGIRWQGLVPIPSGPDLATVSAALPARLDARPCERFEAERQAMLPLPAAPFRAARCVPGVSVSSRSLVKVEGASCSVWSSWARRDVTAYVGADEVRPVLSGDSVEVVFRGKPSGAARWTTATTCGRWRTNLRRCDRCRRARRGPRRALRTRLAPPGTPARPQAGRARLRPRAARRGGPRRACRCPGGGRA